MTSPFSRRDMIKASGIGIAAIGGTGVASASMTEGKSKKDKRTAFITGGARGIGRETALTFARDGLNITLFDIAKNIDGVEYDLATTDDLAKTKREIENLGVQCLTIQGDVRDADAQQNAVEQTISTFGDLDIVVANAAITHFGGVDSHSPLSIKLLLDINVVGVVNSIQAASAHFKQKKSGRFVALSSMAGRGGAENFSVYAAAKWGVIGLMKSAALEYARDGITCNTVCPTAIQTDMLRYVGKAIDPSRPPEDVIGDIFGSIHPTRVPFLEPQEIANAIRFLASEESQFITGAVIDVAAGNSAYGIQ